jgi:hypothetical protein
LVCAAKGETPDAVTQKSLPPTIQKPATAFRKIFTEVFKSAQDFLGHLYPPRTVGIMLN